MFKGSTFSLRTLISLSDGGCFSFRSFSAINSNPVKYLYEKTVNYKKMIHINSIDLIKNMRLKEIKNSK